jgi:hypothetical protein
VVKIATFAKPETVSVIFLTSLCLSGQEERKPIKIFRVNEINIQTGITTQYSSNESLKDFNSLAPQSKLLKADFSGYSSHLGSSVTQPLVLTSAGIEFRNTQKEGYRSTPQLRIGLGYFSGSNLRSSFDREDIERYDTLVSKKTGQFVYLDSVNRRTFFLNNFSQQLRIDASLIFRTNLDKRWSVFTGIGISSGILFNAKTEIQFLQTVTPEHPDPYDLDDSFSDNVYGARIVHYIENHGNKNRFVVSAFIPSGIDLRIGKSNEILKKIHLFYEFRFGMNVNYIPELRNTTNSMIQHSVGLRYRR